MEERLDRIIELLEELNSKLFGRKPADKATNDEFATKQDIVLTIDGRELAKAAIDAMNNAMINKDDDK